MCINTIVNFGAESKVHKKLFLKINQKTQLELRLLIFKAKVHFFKSLKIFTCKLENGHLKLRRKVLMVPESGKSNLNTMQ